MELFVYILYGNSDNFEGVFLIIYYLIPLMSIKFAVVCLEVIRNIWNYTF